MRQSIAFVAAALLVSACGRPMEDPRTQPPMVSVVRVSGDGGDSESFTGVVRARIESDLGFRTPGKIAERLVDPGQTVRRGQALMRLDGVDLALAADAQAAAVAAAKARATQTDADLARLQGLVARGAISAQAYDEARTSTESARAQLDAAEAQARVAVNVRGYAVLTADADGVVEDILAEPGQVVAAGQTVVRLAHAGPREAEAGLPETVRPALGSAATASLYDAPGVPVAAHLRQLSQSADPATRTYSARYVLQGAAANAPLGATVTITLPASGAPDGAVVPLGAVYDAGSGPGVWRVDRDHVVFQPVKVASLEVDSAKVSGLAPGETIVGLGADRLRQGQTIRMAPMPGATR